jgi:hypothetical protein
MKQKKTLLDSPKQILKKKKKMKKKMKKKKKKKNSQLKPVRLTRQQSEVN